MLQLAHPVPHRMAHHGRLETIQPAGINPAPAWQTPLLRTVATEAVGISELRQAIDQHRQHLQLSGEWQQREQARLEAELNLLLQSALVDRWKTNVPEQMYLDVLQQVTRRELSLWQAVQTLMDGDPA
jgi:LAO/AO transport system kinase